MSSVSPPRWPWHWIVAALLVAGCSALGTGPNTTADPRVDAPGDATPTPQPRAVLFSSQPFRTARVFEASIWLEGGQQVPFREYAGINLMLFDDGELHAYTGCGSLVGRWALTDGSFVITDFSRQRNLSEDSCGSDSKAEDDRNAAFLTSSPAYEEEAGSMVMVSGDTEVSFLEGPRPTPSASWPWTLESGSVDGATIDEAQGMATLEFLNDHSARWSFGACVARTGHVTELDDRSFRVDDATKAAKCPMRPRELDAALDTIIAAERVTYELDRGRLTLFAGGAKLEYVIDDE